MIKSTMNKNDFLFSVPPNTLGGIVDFNDCSCGNGHIAGLGNTTSKFEIYNGKLRVYYAANGLVPGCGHSWSGKYVPLRGCKCFYMPQQ